MKARIAAAPSERTAVILHDAAWAPSPRRVRIFLAEKGIEVERRMVDMTVDEQLSESYLRINPCGTVPALVLDDGEVIGDSVAICRYLEALHPDPPLFGSDALEIARIEEWGRRIDAEGYAAVAFAFRNRSKHMVDRGLTGQWPPIAQIAALADRGRTMWPLFVERLEARLADRDWIATDAYSFADIGALVAIDFARRTRLAEAELPPALARWYEQVSARPSAAA